jgi:hypothetical protein
MDLASLAIALGFFALSWELTELRQRQVRLQCRPSHFAGFRRTWEGRRSSAVPAAVATRRFR